MPPDIKFFFDDCDNQDPNFTKLDQHSQISPDSDLDHILKQYQQEDFGSNVEIYQAKLKKNSIIENFNILSTAIGVLNQTSNFLMKETRYNSKNARRVNDGGN